MILDGETIAAVATPAGRGGIGIVRLSGPAARTALGSLLGVESAPTPRLARLQRIVDPATGTLVDEAVVTFFSGPHSYTGEDVLEVAAHGSPVVLAFLLEQALAGGARLARPGEFTERAFLNGRLDLTQAEAVRDLIDASTLHQARLAAEQLGGALARRVSPVKQALLRLIAALEAGIDFAEDDIDVLADEAILAALKPIDAELGALEESFRYGRVLRDGLTMALVGAPNVGKSSLFNRLLDRERAIVTATPGTTRDLISERMAIGGVPVELIDTAGLRTGADEAESLGIAKTREALATADLVLVVSVAGRALTAEETGLVAELAGRPHLLVRNKSDLAEKDVEEDGGVWTSAVTGAGVETLRERIGAAIQGGASAESGMVTNLRQHRAIASSRRSLGETQAAVTARIPHEMLMVGLYASLHALDELTGTTTADDVLHQIFSSFCIGK